MDYQDQDNDGYGDDNTSVIDCISPEGYVTVGGDCNDQVTKIKTMMVMEMTILP